MTKIAASVLAVAACLGLASSAQAQHFAPPTAGHYDYHSAHLERHRLHFHYVKGHYDYHPGYQPTVPLPPAAPIPRYVAPASYGISNFPPTGSYYPGYQAPYTPGRSCNY